MEERLAKIEAQQAETLALLRALAEKVDERQNDTTRHARVLYGMNGHPGLLIRLDRLEQAHGLQKWLVRTLGGAVVTLVLWMLMS